ncbi:MAG: GNAT family N-acetyltransferase [Bacteroidales bacterium]|nr:GNAT family N-acetyltransferase [Bacteroidales bacterium]
MTEKEQYRQLCESHPEIPLFLQHWWMEAVCAGKQWDVLLYRNNDGEVQAVMPFLVGKKLWMRYVLMPQLTQYNGVWYLKNDFRSENERLSFEKKVCNDFVGRLKDMRLDFFLQNFAPRFTNWLPFYWKGFSQTTRYTYQIQNLANLDDVFANFDRNRRQKKILSLEKKYRQTTDITAEEFYGFHSKYWEAKGTKDLFAEKYVVKLCNAAMARRQGVIIGLVDIKTGEKVAMRFVVFDKTTAYSLLSAIEPNSKVNGLSELLFWKVIQYLSGKVRVFDFEGSMVESIEHSYRLYGAKQVPYFQIEKCNSLLLGLLLKLKTKR